MVLILHPPIQWETRGYVGQTVAGNYAINLEVAQLPDRRDLQRLYEVSRFLYGAVMLELYTTITIPAKNEKYLQGVDTERFMVAGINPVSRLQYVRNVRVQSSFSYNPEERCIHYSDTYDMDIDPEEGEDSGFDELTTDIMSLLSQLEDQSLRGFRSNSPFHISLDTLLTS
ncbi:hypothetical protein OIDMADRAFT_61695 [Oidiodendron maius Zn]|uniref:Uncharacterized protein n=1 Tax=Oidiodendron maius (strain Zn) TaxID=913774 RepID=A0A0C3CUF8_OIDMZ|nr:hypothetical protein OIDMADRAFT_61695 [Oidiodendron maius Zn]